MDQIWNAILADALPVLGVLVKGLVAAVVLGGLAQLTVKTVVSPVAASEKTPDFLTPLSTGIPERLTTLLVAQCAVLVAHGLGIWTYGAGGRGYGIAWFFGFLGGGLMPWLHDFVRARFGKAATP